MQPPFCSFMELYLVPIGCLPIWLIRLDLIKMLSQGFLHSPIGNLGNSLPPPPSSNLSKCQLRWRHVQRRGAPHRSRFTSGVASSGGCGCVWSWGSRIRWLMVLRVSLRPYLACLEFSLLGLRRLRCVP
ncbi:unnamed protein product [Brassica oleracea var. botrytis]|uniref:(rape) hypothetical protein n=1 Tax=Brassica napus TaxID=3708 RepID=A0A816IBI8_BRANA|nr:unnamed protein product [Brassica napus]